MPYQAIPKLHIWLQFGLFVFRKQSNDPEAVWNKLVFIPTWGTMRFQARVSKSLLVSLPHESRPQETIGTICAEVYFG